MIAMGAGQRVQQRQLNPLGRERAYVGVAAADGLHGDADVGIAADGIADPYRQDVETGAHRGGAERHGRLGVQGRCETEDSRHQYKTKAYAYKVFHSSSLSAARL